MTLINWSFLGIQAKEAQSVPEKDSNVFE